MARNAKKGGYTVSGPRADTSKSFPEAGQALSYALTLTCQAARQKLEETHYVRDVRDNILSLSESYEDGSVITTLTSIAPEGQLPPESTIPIASGSQGGGFKGGGGMTPERETKIVKQSSLATAGALVGNLFAGLGPEFLAQAEAEQDRLAKKYFAQVMDVT